MPALLDNAIAAVGPYHARATGKFVEQRAKPE
jgi:hypothetical protein